MGRVTKNCLCCGKEFTSFASLNRLYCSQDCFNAHKTGTGYGDYDETQNWVQTGHSRRFWLCPYADNVECGMRNCGSCGWNPDVAKERTERFMVEHGIPVL